MPTAEHFLMHSEFVQSHQVLANAADDPGKAMDFLRHTASSLQKTQLFAQQMPEELIARPLSDDLGNYRLLRTSTLSAVPEVCCVDC